jgi:GT2 family glycosyltransferase
MFLDADDRLHPSYLRETYAALTADPTAGFAYTDRHDFGDIDKDVPSLPYDLPRLSRACYVNCCALMRRAAFDAAGGYKTNVNGMEDWDLWLSIGEAGYRGVHVAQTLFWYRRHESGLFAHAQQKKDERIAQIIVNHPALYSAEDVRSAELYLKHVRLAALQERLKTLESHAEKQL